MAECSSLLRRVMGGEHLSQDEAASFVGEIMDGNYTAPQAAALLVALGCNGESVDEIRSARRARCAHGPSKSSMGCQ